MDVHPPQHPIHNLKDFLIHLLTITIGLFIALSLEAAVEAAHHRHLVRDARENLRREIDDNRQLYAKNARAIHLNRARLALDIEQFRELRSGKKLDNPTLSWAWEWDSYADAAWKTARESGATPYMNPGWISTYTEIYAQQDYVNSTALAIVNEETGAGAPLRVVEDPSKLGADEVQKLLIKSAEIDLSLETLETTMKALDGMYVDGLKKP